MKEYQYFMILGVLLIIAHNTTPEDKATARILFWVAALISIACGVGFLIFRLIYNIQK